MVKFRTTVDKNGRIYIAKPLRQSCIANTIEILPNAKAAVIYEAGTRIDDILSSLRVIMADLRNRARQEAEQDR